MIVYSKFNNDRKKDFQLITKIEENNGAISVIKESVYQESHGFLNSFISKYKHLIKNNFSITPIKPLKINNYQIKFDYKNEQTLEYLLFICLKNKNKLKFIELVDDYYQKIGEQKVNTKIGLASFNQVFGKTDLNYKAECINSGCLDLNFDNIIIDDKKWFLIDYEWVFEGVNIPIKYIFFRALTYFYFNYAEYNPHLLVPLSFFYEKYNISNEDQDKFIEFEYNFQIYVSKKKTIEQLLFDNFFAQYNFLKNNSAINNRKYLINEKEQLAEEIKRVNQETESLIQEININYDLESKINELNQLIHKLELDINKIHATKAFKLWRIYCKILGK